MKHTRLVRAALSALAVLSLAVAPLLVPATAQAAETGEDPQTVSADALPTVQVNGVVRDQEVVGDIVYAVGEFTSARPAGSAEGQNETPRTNALAYDIRTGELLDWAPAVNGAIYSVAAGLDGSVLYLGGSFTTLNGQSTWYVGAVRPDGTRKPLGASANAHVNAVAVSSDGRTLYIGGSFTQLNRDARLRFGALDLTTNKLTSQSANIPDYTVRAVVGEPNGTGVAVGGSFSSINGTSDPGYGMGVLEADGTLRKNNLTKVARNAKTYGGITSLVTDGESLYGSGYSQTRSQANIEGSFRADWKTGDLSWLADCHGDNYDVLPTSQVVYVASHTHDCRNIGGQPNSTTLFNFGTAYTNYATGKVQQNVASGYYNHAGNPAPTQLNFFPTFKAGTYTGKSQATWTVEGNSDYVVYGGEFTAVNGAPQQGLVRFARRDIAPNQSGPVNTGANYPMTATSPSSGLIHLVFSANWDRDDRVLTYKVYRDTLKSQPIWTKEVAASYWQLPEMVVNDSVDPGSTHRYIVTVEDSRGAGTRSGWVSATAASEGTLSPYGATVLKDGAVHYWPQDETSGTAASDLIGGDVMTFVGKSYTRGAGGVLNASSTLSNSRYTKSFGTTTTAQEAPAAFSEEAWFRTTTSSGGVIMSYSSSTTGDGSYKDRMVYMATDGKLMYMVYPGRAMTLGSTRSYNDGKWHHMVLTQDPVNGATMYVDGASVAADPSINRAQDYDGFWRIGGDSVSGIPSAPYSSYFKGDIDEVAVYPTALASSQVVAHHVVGRTGKIPNQVPDAGLVLSASRLTLTADGSGSKDTDGKVVSWSWDFGDGTTGEGVTATHTYATAGTYKVRLTVTDDAGATDVTEQEMTVEDPNEAPKASTSVAVNGLGVSVDASASSDTDGKVVSWSWDFGDGTTGEGVTATHTYATAGDYTVTLTATDDRGASGTVTAAVSVADPGPDTETEPGDDPATLFSDTFTRQSLKGWGAADKGGDWSIGFTRSAFAANGAQGVIALQGPGTSAAVSSSPISSTSTDSTMDLSLDAMPTGSGAFISYVGRSTDAGRYQVTVRVGADGAVYASVTRRVGSKETTLGSTRVAGTYSAGQVIHLRFVVDGADSTALRARLWTGDTEPQAWGVDVVDNDTTLSAAGSVGFRTFNSANAAASTVNVTIDNLTVKQIS